jgi:hypothetical protein
MLKIQMKNNPMSPAARWVNGCLDRPMEKDPDSHRLSPRNASCGLFSSQIRFVLMVFLTAIVNWSAYGMSDVKVFTIAGNVFELDLLDSTEKGLIKIPIEIWSGDQKITTIETGPKGKYKIDLAYYPSYTLRFGKAPYVTKVIDIQTDGVHRAAEFGIVNLDLDITLFRNENYMGLDFLNYTPIAKASFNKKKGQLVWDADYGAAMNSRVRGVIEANKNQ